MPRARPAPTWHSGPSIHVPLRHLSERCYTPDVRMIGFYSEVHVNPILTDETTLSTPTFFQLQEEDRYRLARALSNGPGQILANTLIELDHALTLLDADPDAARKGLSALREEVRVGLADLKAHVAELQPPLLEELGLGPSLEHYLADFGNRNKI